MIEVTIWWGNINGDSSSSYLVRTSPVPFKSPTLAYVRAIDTAMAQLMREQPAATVDSVKVRSVPDRVLEVPS
jgi:hypothetical protein